MTCVFISHAKEDRALAEGLAQYLDTRGFDVWWDAKLLSSENFDDAIRDALVNAKAAIVIWTSNSAKSLYVRDEARFALFNNKLVTVKEPRFRIIDIPFGFQSQHTEDITQLERIAEAVNAVDPTIAAEALRPLASMHDEKRGGRSHGQPTISGLRAFWEGFRLNISSFLPFAQSRMAVAGAIIGTVFFSLLTTAFVFWLLTVLRSRQVGTDVENHIAFVVLCVPWLMNLKMINELFRQRAFWGGWVLGVFWAALTILFATAATYTVATLLGEPDMERFQMGNRVLVVVAVLGPLAAMGYVFSRSLKYK
jgi:hypothetical protein